MKKNGSMDVSIPEVKGTSEFGYEIVVRGKWDWNNYVAGSTNESIIGSQRRPGAFFDSMQGAIASMIFDACIGAESVQLTEAELTPEMSAAWNRYQAELKDADRERLESELAELEKKAAAVKARLGRRQ